MHVGNGVQYSALPLPILQRGSIMSMMRSTNSVDLGVSSSLHGESGMIYYIHSLHVYTKKKKNLYGLCNTPAHC